MADANTNNNSATNDKGAGEGIVFDECSMGSSDDALVLFVLAVKVAILSVEFRLYGSDKLPLETADGELILAKEVLGNDENTKLSDAKLITISKTPNHSEVLLVLFGWAPHFVFCRVIISYFSVTFDLVMYRNVPFGI